MSEESFVYTACPGWGDHEYCAIKTIVKDGRIIRTEHVDYTGAESKEGYICQKGLASCKQPYNPDRLLTPLKRAGKRGEGKWEKISWEQALDEIAEKLLKLRDEYGPASLAVWSLPASVPPVTGLGALLSARFAGLWGAIDPIFAYGVDNGPVFSNFFSYNDPFLYYITDPANFDDSKYIIVWGANPIENQQRIARHIIEAQSRGAKIVDIGLIFDGTAGKADWFIPIKPGADPALALGMANLIVQNGWYEKEFLLAHTTMPFLLRKDTGAFLYNDEGGRYVWDEVNNKPVATEFGVKTIDARPALDGEYTVDGIACETVFKALKRHLSQYTLESVAGVTGVPEADIAKLADEYAHTKFGYIVGALGLRYQNAGESYRAFSLLAALTGQLGQPGGGVTAGFNPTSYPAVFNDLPITRPLGPEGNKTVNLRQEEFFERVKTSNPQPVKALLKMSGNPIHNNANRSRWIEETCPQLDLIVDFDIWLTDTGEYADYVLPDCMSFERTEIISLACYNHIVLQEPAIKPEGEARDATYFLSELAKRVGLGEYFNKTAEEWLAIRLETEWPLIKNIDPPLTWERLKKEKMVRMVAPDFPKFDPFRGLQFPTASGRMEIFSEELLDLGHGFTTYCPPLEAPVIEGNAKYPYQFFTGRQRFFMQSMFTDDPVMVALSGGKPAIRMNPLDASREGLIDGDKIECYNQRGHMVATLRLDEAVPPGTVHAWFGWRHRHFEDGMYSELLVPSGGAEVNDDLARRWWDVQIQSGGLDSPYAGGTMALTGTWDTLWDCACAVRKASKKEGGCCHE